VTPGRLEAIVPAARIESILARPLSVPLREPFVIATARMVATRSVEVTARLTRVNEPAVAVGLGESAALPPVTREDQPDIVRAISLITGTLEGTVIHWPALAERLDALLPHAPVTRAGVEVALLDAAAKLAGVPLRVLVGGDQGAATRTLTTDITLPIGEPERMASLARRWRTRGFSVFKVKVGQDLDHDVRALEAIAFAVPDARFRIDANAGFSAKDAITLARALERGGHDVECYEQPCAAGDLDAMAEVAAAVAPPVIADESVASLEDLVRIVQHRAADGVNLKLAKSGGLLAALVIGREAQRRGMPLMVGGMVETRLGMTAGAHLAAALGGVQLVDLDTAWLLSDDPYEGGYRAEGPHYDLGLDVGLGVQRRA
jgi:L-alanine-DL-glutamate epimerase-like enolase superfamily enzyme